ncbi:MAG: hypothetical protein G5701_08655 [Serratia symbiotica]|nr:hypothetical protein [Serratia symbiotica]
MAIWGVARSKLQGFQHCGDFHRGWDAQSPAAPTGTTNHAGYSGPTKWPDQPPNPALVGVATYSTALP